MKENKKQIAKISIFITSIFVIFLSVTYAFINQTLTGTKRQVITAGNLSLILEEDEPLQINNAMPMYDDVGLIQTPFNFRLINQGTDTLNYIIKLRKIANTSELPDSIVRYGLTKDGNIKNVNTLSSLEGTYGQENEINRDDYRADALNYCKAGFPDANIQTEEECVNTIKNQAASSSNVTLPSDFNFNDFIDMYIAGELIPTNQIQMSTNAKAMHVCKTQARLFDNVRITTEEECVAYMDRGSLGSSVKTFQDVVNKMIEQKMITDDPSISNNKETLTIDTGRIKGKQTIEYELRLWIDSGVIDETLIKDKTLTYKIDIEAEQEAPLPELPAPKSTIMARPLYGEDQKFWWHDDYIVKVVFDTTVNVPEDVADDLKWDVSEAQDGSVMAYLENKNQMTRMASDDYILHIQGENGVYANPDSSSFFSDFYGLVEIEGLEYFNTSKVTTMQNMFYRCENLVSLDVRYFDTSNVTNFSQMLCGCSNLTDIDLTNFDLSKSEDVTTTDDLFTCSPM